MQVFDALAEFMAADFGESVAQGAPLYGFCK